MLWTLVAQTTTSPTPSDGINWYLVGTLVVFGLVALIYAIWHGAHENSEPEYNYLWYRREATRILVQLEAMKADPDARTTGRAGAFACALQAQLEKEKDLIMDGSFVLRDVVNEAHRRTRNCYIRFDDDSVLKSAESMLMHYRFAGELQEFLLENYPEPRAKETVNA